MAYRKRNYNRRPRAKIARRRKAANAKPTKAFTKKVMSIIHKQAETKCEASVQNSLTRDAAISVIGDVIYALPSISKGTNDNQRVGDQVRAQKLTIKGHLALNLTYQNQAACRVGVRMMICQPKTYNSADNVSANFASWLPNLLKRGGTTTSFSGLIQDLYTPINTDLVSCYYDKVHYMTVPAILNYAGVTDVDNYVTSDNRQSIKFFSKTFNLRNKLLKFDSLGSSGLYPTNMSWSVLVGFARLDGSAITTDTQVLYNHVSTLYWEDC